MNGKARLIALSGICGAVNVCCMLLATLPVVKWFALLLAVLCAVVTVMPMLVDGRGLMYSLLIYAVSCVFGIWLGLGNILYVAPILAYCMPAAIVKVRGESMRITARLERTETVEDPFDPDAEQQAVTVQLVGKPHLPAVVRWVLYYVLLEAGICLTLVATYFLTPAAFTKIYETKWVFWLLVAAAQLFVPLYDLLLRGCLIGTQKILRRVMKF